MSAPALTWPALPLDAWSDTCATLQLWTQMAGKVRLMLTPRINHWWNVALYVNSRGLTTSPMPSGSEDSEIQFDFIHHRCEITTSTGRAASLDLKPRTVADFYRELLAALARLDIQVTINPKPQELPNPILFDQDTTHAGYDPEYAHRFWRILLSTHAVMLEFRSRFIGKCSPIHFFWGGFDLACTRFNGKPAPPRKGLITSEGYSHECISHGFWPGMGLGAPAFYSYTAPAPPGLKDDPSARRFWNDQLSEFILPYEEVRTSKSPKATLLDFCQATYEAGAKAAAWDRASLER